MESLSSYHPTAGNDSVMPRIELQISCTNLINMDTFSLSDPMVVVYMADHSGNWREIGKTEMVKDNLNPKFVKSILVDYHFEEVQNLKFVCVDIDDEKHLNDMSRHDYIGETYCKLSEIITAPAGKLQRELKHPKLPDSKRGFIIIQFEEVQNLNNTVSFTMLGRGLDKKDFFGKSDPFLVISKVREQGEYVPVFKTEVIKKTLDPSWRPFSISVQKLCNGDFERPLMIECFDWNRSGKHELIGQFKTNLRELLEPNKEFPLINAAMTKKKNYKNSGTIRVVQSSMEKHSSFIDFIQGGCELSLVVGIDFTASNGNPQYSNSLHYNNPVEPNEYVKAILAVGEILTEYDSDKLFPVYGFGAKLPPTGQVSHCFPLNGNFQNPEVYGLQGILDAYHSALSTVTLYGPTIFSQLIRTTVSSMQHCTQDVQKYTILLIITDGVIDDMEQTINEIVKYNDYPLSIIIVGVGSADFKNMEILDADDNPLKSSTGEIAKRDIVQFVPFSQFKNSPPSRLAKELLEEIPSQLLSYMASRNIKPNPMRVGITQFDPMRTGGAHSVLPNSSHFAGVDASYMPQLQQNPSGRSGMLPVNPPIGQGSIGSLNVGGPGSVHNPGLNSRVNQLPQQFQQQPLVQQPSSFQQQPPPSMQQQPLVQQPIPQFPQQFQQQFQQPSSFQQQPAGSFQPSVRLQQPPPSMQQQPLGQQPSFTLPPHLNTQPLPFQQQQQPQLHHQLPRPPNQRY